LLAAGSADAAGFEAAASVPVAVSAPDDALPDDPADELLDLALEALERSFLAQPAPLKWTAEGTIRLRIEPSTPQLGQKLGPASLIPWITSTMWPQAEQA